MVIQEIINKIREIISNKIQEIIATQKFEKTFDFTRSFVARAGVADSVAIPITNEGPFVEHGINICYTKNSKLIRQTGTDPESGDPITKTINFCAVKVKFKSQSDNAGQSNDYIPIKLISTPGADDMPRYGARPFLHVYPKGDILIIDYDNREPEKLISSDVYEIEDEQIDICFSGKLYPLNN